MSASSGRSADPAIAARLAEDMRSLRNLVDASDVATFVEFDDVLIGAEGLMQSLETAVYAARQVRRINDDST